MSGKLPHGCENNGPKLQLQLFHEVQPVGIVEAPQSLFLSEVKLMSFLFKASNTTGMPFHTRVMRMQHASRCCSSPGPVCIRGAGGIVVAPRMHAGDYYCESASRKNNNQHNY